MKSFRQYLAALDRLATAQSPQIDRKKLYRAILATTFIAGSQFLSAISASANQPPTPAQPSPLLPTRFILNGNFEDTQVTNWVGPYQNVDNTTKAHFINNSWNEVHKTKSDGTSNLSTYNSLNPETVDGERYRSTTSFSSTLGAPGNNIATANVRMGYNEPQFNPAAKPVIWLTSETGEFRSIWNYSDAIEIFRGDCSQTSTQGNIPGNTSTNPTRTNYNPCGEKSAPKPLVAGNAVNGTTATNGTADSPTNQFAEIQGSALATLYQDIYVFNGEEVKWSLRHAARNVTPGTDQTNIMQVSIADPANWNGLTPPVNQANAYYSSKGDFSTSGRYPGTKKTTGTDPITSARPFIATTVNDGWKKYEGSWTATNTNPKLMRFGFTAIQGSTWGVTGGNFIDDVVVKLTASADFLPTDRENEGKNVNLGTHTEGNTANPYYLSLRINGKTTGGTITIRMIGLNVAVPPSSTSSTPRTFNVGTVLKGSAAGSGMSTTKDGEYITLTIPAGTYNPNLPADYIHIPIDFSNTVTQPNNSLVFSLYSQSGDLMVPSSSGNIQGMGRTEVGTQLIDDDITQYQKRVELPVTRPVRIAAH
jgi:hypothetical protein